MNVQLQCFCAYLGKTIKVVLYHHGENWKVIIIINDYTLQYEKHEQYYQLQCVGSDCKNLGWF